MALTDSWMLLNITAMIESSTISGRLWPSPRPCTHRQSSLSREQTVLDSYWIIQEVVVARCVKVMCGVLSVRLRSFLISTSTIGVERQKARYALEPRS
ncbi:hypothetical protein BU25DRAFT_408914 [Macroventuria anomochaeta]|uniref:Uncharacterized protein n=1 Tax=Macroventuria anomochaeta TaxID=301207 RepID=A0ACB6S5V9_9PLEO|nr:uncharacterized protein BU25DRAFT_408914 [Macroventuria anomochaeta]KAF2629646.1 hypothetical protein BU25DRAFT_408914 [Macroventuria anomochaeta]